MFTNYLIIPDNRLKVIANSILKNFSNKKFAKYFDELIAHPSQLIKGYDEKDVADVLFLKDTINDFDKKIKRLSKEYSLPSNYFDFVKGGLIFPNWIDIMYYQVDSHTQRIAFQAHAQYRTPKMLTVSDYFYRANKSFVFDEIVKLWKNFDEEVHYIIDNKKIDTILMDELNKTINFIEKEYLINIECHPLLSFGQSGSVLCFELNFDIHF